MRPPEWIALAYFGYLAATAVLGPAGPTRTRVLARTAVVILLIVVLGEASSRDAQRVRDWMPGLYAVLGYWIPGMLVSGPSLRLENRLESLDAWLLPAIDRFVTRAPRVLLECLELTYLCCYALVPGAFVWIAVNGRVTAADQFWTTVLLALYPCYGLVPWLPTRPPRVIEPMPAIDRRQLTLRRLNLRVLRRLSIQTNTFPSGHAAGALAAAAAVGLMLPLSGLVIGAVAISIAVASVVGRYHYAADALAGTLVAVAAVACAGRWLALF
jgi:membrane-associated phospholipid phosphatase